MVRGAIPQSTLKIEDRRRLRRNLAALHTAVFVGAGALLAMTAAPAPALAQQAQQAEQAEEAPAPSEGGARLPGGRRPGEGLGRSGEGGARFQPVPLGPDGKPLEYVPPAPPQPPTVEAEVARLRLLDKMTGQVRTVEMRPGETRREDRLEIVLESCRVPKDDERRDAYAYLVVRDVREAAPRFLGWMFASSPALSALDHARYDLWVESCSTSAGEAASESE